MRNNAQLHGGPEGDNRIQERQSLFEEMMAENFPELIKDINFSSGSTINPKQGIKKKKQTNLKPTHGPITVMENSKEILQEAERRENDPPVSGRLLNGSERG